MLPKGRKRTHDGTLVDAVKCLSSVGVAPHKVEAYLDKTIAGAQIPKHDIYNLKRRHHLGERKEIRQAERAMKLLEDLGFSKRYDVFKGGPQAGRLMELDAMHPDMTRRYGRHPDILTTDVTFRTNVYDRNLLNVVSATPMNTILPVYLHLLDGQDKEHFIRHLSWIREQFTSRNIPPRRAVMTDREQALINALNVVFPECAILICEWHINTDIKAKLRRDCGARFH